MSPRLLVSVRNADETQAAIRGGADIIDIKEPRHGSLGAAAADVIQDVGNVVKQSAFPGPVSAALGELLEFARDRPPQITGLRWVKAGLSNCHGLDWQRSWRELQDRVHRQRQGTELMAVAYADWRECAAPPPDEVVTLAISSKCPGVLFDTFHKDGRHLFDHLPPGAWPSMRDRLRDAGRFIALAGSIGPHQLPTLAALRPEIIAVRSAVCVGGRNGRVDAGLVAEFRAAISSPNPVVTAREFASATRR